MARGDFDGQSNPDLTLTASQKEWQRRTFKAQFTVTNRQYITHSTRAATMPQPTLAQDLHAPTTLDSQTSSLPGTLTH